MCRPRDEPASPEGRSPCLSHTCTPSPGPRSAHHRGPVALKGRASPWPTTLPRCRTTPARESPRSSQRAWPRGAFPPRLAPSPPHGGPASRAVSANLTRISALPRPPGQELQGSQKHRLPRERPAGQLLAGRPSLNPGTWERVFLGGGGRPCTAPDGAAASADPREQRQ